MSNHFVKAALDKIWCAPEMDKQSIIRPARVSHQAGSILKLRVMFDSTNLPTPGDRYHVFQFGQLPKNFLGIEAELYDWLPACEMANSSELKLNVYTDDGIEIPKKLIYFKIIEGNNLLMAVRYATEKGLPDLGLTAIYVRFYSNAYMESSRSDGVEAFIHLHSAKINTPQDAADFINLYNKFDGYSGLMMFFRNGRLSELPTVGNLVAGDYWEFHFDGSIYKKLVFSVSELETYLSTMDKVRRYIIHPKKADITVDSIFYRDDLDFYVLGGEGIESKGLYLHRNLERNVRMLTHNDYGIGVEHVQSLADSLNYPRDNVKVVLFLRHSGFERPLVYERHFIHELYKLRDVDIVKAMARKGLAVEYWAADCLEASHYTKIMRRSDEMISEDDALKAFGYGGASTQVQDSPVLVDGEFTLPVPTGFHGEILLMYQDYINGTFHAEYQSGLTVHTAIPFSKGVFDYRLASAEHREAVYIDAGEFPINPYMGFSCYKARKQAGQRSGEWIDVTASESDYVVENGIFKWLIDLPLYHVAVVPGDYSSIRNFRSDNIRDLTIDLKDNGDMLGAPIPVAENIIVVGGYVLAEEIDYIENNGVVKILNRDVINKVGEQDVWVIRLGSGHNKSRTETGCVRYNSLSRDGNYDLHEGLIVQCISDGKIIPKSHLAFAEDNTESQHLRSGAPYTLKYYRGPIANTPWFKVSDLRNDYDVTAAQIGHYLSSILEEAPKDYPDAIAYRYGLYSPFIDTIARDIENGTLVIQDKPLTDSEIMALLSAYTPLLAFEPTLSEHYNSTWIEVKPLAVDGMITVSKEAFYVIGRAIAIWLENRIDIHNQIGISQ